MGVRPTKRSRSSPSRSTSIRTRSGSSARRRTAWIRTPGKIAFEDGQAEKTFNVTPNGARRRRRRPTQPAVVAHNDSSSTPPRRRRRARRRSRATVRRRPRSPPSDRVREQVGAPATPPLKINLPCLVVRRPRRQADRRHPSCTSRSRWHPRSCSVNSEESLKKTITAEVKAGETKAAGREVRERKRGN